jgi:tRNA(Ile)-lysidine synthase
MILDLVSDNLKAEGLLQSAPRTHLALAFSGGTDSMALLFILHELKTRYSLQVTALYVNHGWRGTPPPELPLLHRQCVKCETPLIVVQADRTLPKTENAARQMRYQRLTAAAQDLRANALLTAHHADDQIETILFRLLRGTGLDGLSGIHQRLVLTPPVGQSLPILRPMLDVSRKRIEDYLESHKIETFQDPSNQDVKYQRNNIRHKLLPTLEESFPQVKNALFRLSLVAEGDLQILEEAIDRLWNQVFARDEQGAFLKALPFNQLGTAYQRRVLKRFLSGQDIHADFQAIEELLMFIRGEGRHNLDASLKSLVQEETGRNRFLSLYKGCLRIVDIPQEAPPAFCYPVTVPGHFHLTSQNQTFTVQPWRAPEKVAMSPIRPQDSQQVYVDLSLYQDKPLELRTRRPGDKFQPMGMDVALRLKKFLINRGVPRFERNQLLVLASGNIVLWIPGLGINHQLRIRPKTAPTHLLQLRPGLHSEPLFLMEGPVLEEEEKPVIKPAPVGARFEENDDDLLIEEDDDE